MTTHESWIVIQTTVQLSYTHHCTSAKVQGEKGTCRSSGFLFPYAGAWVACSHVLFYLFLLFALINVSVMGLRTPP